MARYKASSDVTKSGDMVRFKVWTEKVTHYKVEQNLSDLEPLNKCLIQVGCQQYNQ